jgi:hypothetical protein
VVGKKIGRLISAVAALIDHSLEVAPRPGGMACAEGAGGGQ